MKGEISYRDLNRFLYQAVNMFISAVKLGILTWGSIWIDSLLEPASSGQSRNCSFWHFCVGFIFQQHLWSYMLLMKLSSICQISLLSAVIEVSFDSQFKCQKSWFNSGFRPTTDIYKLSGTSQWDAESLLSQITLSSLEVIKRKHLTLN